MAPPSDVWRLFDKIGKLEARCKVCLKTLKTGGGATNLKNHIKRHPDFGKTNETEETVDDVEPMGHENENENDDDALTSNKSRTRSLMSGSSSGRSRSASSSTSRDVRSRSPSLSRSRPRDRQQTLFEAADRVASYEKGGTRDAMITNALIFMVCKDNAPHSIVEKEGFRNFTKTLAPLYKLPSRNNVTEMVTLRYSATLSKIKSQLQNVEHIGVTADICTLTNTSRGFLVLTAHFICPESHKLETVMLEVRRLLDTHTADNLAREMEEMLQSFNIPNSKIVAVCTDGAANIMAAVRKLLGEGKNVYCFAHLLHLIVGDGVDDNE